MKQVGHLVLLFAITALAHASSPTPAEIKSVDVSPQGQAVKIELTLSAGVAARVEVARNPDRLVLELPNTATANGQRAMTVDQNGVQRVRVALHQMRPFSSRVVVDMDGPHPYLLTTSGNTVTLTVLPLPPGQAASDTRPWFGRLMRRQPRVPAMSMEDASNTNPASALVVTPQSREALSFKVKYVAEGAAYVSGGRTSGLVEGMKLIVREGDGGTQPDASHGRVVAELRVVSVAETSAVTDIHAITRTVRPGEWAFLSVQDYQALLREQNAGKRRKSISNSFVQSQSGQATEAIKEEQTEPPHIRARIGVDYSGISSSGSTAASSSQIGLSFRTDMTHIGGSHWNLQGYWRGRLTKNSQPLEQTMQDYLDRTYTIQLYYDNPNSRWVSGVGRLYLPWAISLDTIDGGYLGRKFGKGGTLGVFGGSTPDPTSWHYAPDQQIVGSFVNFEGGSYDHFHYSSTSGFALNMLDWKLDRPYVFFENGITYARFLSIDHSMIVDAPQGLSTGGVTPGAGVSRSYLSLHVQPKHWISFDVYHNYFRDVPTAATQLIGTGLVDKLLYQGLNVGVRIEPVRNVAVYTTLGQSSRTGDARHSLNQMYGLTWSEIWHTGLRADLRYSKFDSSFARGDYKMLSLSRQVGDRVLWSGRAGVQTLASPFTVNQRSLFFDTSFDTNLTSHTFLQSGYTIGRGALLNYDQWYVSLGYRFDVRESTK